MVLAGVSPEREKLATSPTPNPTCREITNCMVLGGGRYQAATQVNVLSPEISIVTEADTFHVEGRQHCCNREGEGAVALSGSKAAAWYYMEPIGTWEIQSTLPIGE